MKGNFEPEEELDRTREEIQQAQKLAVVAWPERPILTLLTPPVTFVRMLPGLQSGAQRLQHMQWSSSNLGYKVLLQKERRKHPWSCSKLCTRWWAVTWLCSCKYGRYSSDVEILEKTFSLLVHSRDGVGWSDRRGYHWRPSGMHSGGVRRKGGQATGVRQRGCRRTVHNSDRRMENAPAARATHLKSRVDAGDWRMQHRRGTELVQIWEWSFSVPTRRETCQPKWTLHGYLKL